MRHLLAGGLPLIALAGVISGCDLEFVDVDIEGPSQLNLRVHTDSDQDSIQIIGDLYRGFDETGQRRSVLSSLQIDDEVLTPEVTARGDWTWRLSVPASTVADGRLIIQPPILEGLGSVQPIEFTIPAHVGGNRIEILPGEPIPLRFTFSAISIHWRVRLLDAEDVTHYSAESRNPPSGQLIIPGELLPSAAPGPHRAELELVTDTSTEFEAGQYGVRMLTIGRLNWVIVRRDQG